VVGIGREPRGDGLRRGDIHIAALPDVGGSVIRGPHPVVVVQIDRLARSTTVVVVPLTSSALAAEFKPPFLVQVLARSSGLPRDGWAKCDQPLTIPVGLLGGRLGRLNPETIERMDGALRFVLGL
jgi:mRNA-degrading endonuclease toxin of MazEF toxin-antitoxin module